MTFEIRARCASENGYVLDHRSEFDNRPYENGDSDLPEIGMGLRAPLGKEGKVPPRKLFISLDVLEENHGLDPRKYNELTDDRSYLEIENEEGITTVDYYEFSRVKQICDDPEEI